MSASDVAPAGSAAQRFNGFERLRIKPVINACGIFTDLGGSILSAEIWSVITELNSFFVDLPELLDRTGERIAELLGCEAARITPGASAAIALAVAACVVDRKAALGERLPDTSGLRGELVMQHAQAAAYKYLVAVRISGAKVVRAGSASGCTGDELRNAIGENTAAVFIPAHLDELPGCLSIEQVARIAHDQGIPVVVDAAYLNFPPQIMRSFRGRGADITCFSSKYIGGPNAGGFLCGRGDLIAAVRGLDFTHHESGDYRRFGRAFKQGRYEIAAVQLALEEWFRLDHSKRLAAIAERARRLAQLLSASDQVSTQLKLFTMDGRLVEGPINAVVVSLARSAERSTREVMDALTAGYPSIRTLECAGQMVLVTETLRDGEEELLAERLCRAVAGK